MARLKEYNRRQREDAKKLQDKIREMEAEQAVLNVDDTLQALNELGVDTDDQ
jgi:hypothetical protein